MPTAGKGGYIEFEDAWYDIDEDETPDGSDVANEYERLVKKRRAGSWGPPGCGSRIVAPESSTSLTDFHFESFQQVLGVADFGLLAFRLLGDLAFDGQRAGVAQARRACADKFPCRRRRRPAELPGPTPGPGFAAHLASLQ